MRFSNSDKQERCLYGIRARESENLMTTIASIIRKSVQAAIVTLTMLVMMIFAGCTPSVVHEGVIGESIIPIMLEYTPDQRKQSVDKYETKQFTINSKEWEEWINPTVDVTFRLKKDGGIQIKECTISVAPSSADNHPVFVIKETKTEIEHNKIKCVLTGYTDYGYSQEKEQIISFVVRFVPSFLGRTDLNESYNKEG